jgi:hypothetical protein
MLLTDICHAVEGPSVNQRELYNNDERMSIKFFKTSSGGRTCGDGWGTGEDMKTYLNLIRND